MGAPQIILCIVFSITVGIAIYKHGETKESKYNAYGEIATSLFWLLILAWGGFFS